MVVVCIFVIDCTIIIGNAFHKQLSMCHISPLLDVFRATMSSSTAHFGMIQGFRQELCRQKKMKPSS